MRRYALTALAALFTATPCAARTWHILPDGTGDAPTIQAGIDSATAGDTVELACGTYFEHDIVMRPALLLRGQTDSPGCTTIDAQQMGRVLSCEGAGSDTVLQWLTITGGLAEGPFPANAGGGVFFNQSGDGPTVEDCRFVANHAEGYGGGLHGGFTGTITVRRCEFIGNSSDYIGGAFLSGWAAAQACSPVFENCIFAGNRAAGSGGIYCTMNSYGSLEISNCTFHDNGFGSIVLQDVDIAIDHTIITGSSEGPAFSFAGSGNIVDVVCTDVFGNAGGDWVGAVADLEGINGNFASDPRFCDAENADFWLASDSPCLAANNSCGVLIGAKGDGCSTSGNTSLRWSQIKSAYR